MPMKPSAGTAVLLVERKTLVDHAADTIRQGILEGVFLPGSRLLETWLAVHMQLSRGTVRAALRELTHEGIVRAIPYAGWEVAQLTVKDARELCSVRAALEGLAARLAAEAISPEKAERLQTAYLRLTESARSKNHRQCVKNDIALHKTIFELSENKRLIDLYEQIEHQIGMFVAFSDLQSDFGELASWHATLVAGICEGDGESAERIAKENAEKNGRELIARLERNIVVAEPKAASAGHADS